MNFQVSLIFREWKLDIFLVKMYVKWSSLEGIRSSNLESLTPNLPLLKGMYEINYYLDWIKSYLIFFIETHIREKCQQQILIPNFKKKMLTILQLIDIWKYL
jgi:hypothetical protein